MKKVVSKVEVVENISKKKKKKKKDLFVGLKKTAVLSVTGKTKLQKNKNMQQKTVDTGNNVKNQPIQKGKVMLNEKKKKPKNIQCKLKAALNSSSNSKSSDLEKFLSSL